MSHRVLKPVLLVAVGLVAYFESFWGVFLFDDRLHVLGYRRLSTLWPPWEALSRRRPVVDYSLAVNYEMFGGNMAGYHVVNFAIHALAGLALFGIVRRTLARTPSSHGLRTDAAATTGFGNAWIAFFVAAIWLVHPLQTQSVTYIVQRAESLMGLFYLLTLYCVIRGIDTSQRDDSKSGLAWYTAAVLSCAMGMGCKAVMISAPIVILLYDRCLVSGSIWRSLRVRWGLYAALFATWGVSFGTGIVRGVFNTASKRAHVGFGYKGISPIEYLQTQASALLHYVSLSLWPKPLCLDYKWDAVESLAEAAIPGLLIVVLLVSAVLAYRSRPAVAFAGVWFFGILSPTSSIVPIKDPVFEHRMYLSLAAVVVLSVVAMRSGIVQIADRLRWSPHRRRAISTILAVTVITVFCAGSSRRNQVYHHEAGMWRDVLYKQPRSGRAAENYGTALLGEGSLNEALTVLEGAVALAPRSHSAHNALGFALVAAGRLGEATVSFRESLRIRPNFERAMLNLGNVLSDTGQPMAAIEQYEKAIRVYPTYSEARLNLGNERLKIGQMDEALRHYREILRLEPENAKAWGNLGFALLNSGADDEATYQEALTALRNAIKIDPRNHNALNNLGIANATRGRFGEARKWFERTLAVKPDFGGAHYNLAGVLIQENDLSNAIRHYRTAVQLEPGNYNAHFELGSALERIGDLAGAANSYRAALRAKPDHARARAALAKPANQP